MPNLLSSSGLQTSTQPELYALITTKLKDIYGPDINLDSDSPDGQMMMIFMQVILDNLDLVKQVYNSFNPDAAIGKVLDQRVAINGIQRQAGTYSTVMVTVVTSQIITLYGLDQEVEEVYTIQDNAGTKWKLLNTKTALSISTHPNIEFRAENPGAVLATSMTINTPVTIKVGVSQVYNPSTTLVKGINEESDFDLKIRRQKSVSLSSQGYLSSLLAALKNVSGVSSAVVHENTTGSTDIDGIPSHSIWVIVGGTASHADIAAAIYLKRSAGAGMYGSQTYQYLQIDGTSLEIKWDVVSAETLYIQFTASSLDEVSPIDANGIKTYIANNLSLGVNEQFNINDLATLVQEFDDNCLVTASGLGRSSIGPFFNKLSPLTKNKQFSVSAINIAVTVV